VSSKSIADQEDVLSVLDGVNEWRATRLMPNEMSFTFSNVASPFMFRVTLGLDGLVGGKGGGGGRDSSVRRVTEAMGEVIWPPRNRSPLSSFFESMLRVAGTEQSLSRIRAPADIPRALQEVSASIFRVQHLADEVLRMQKEVLISRGNSGSHSLLLEYSSYELRTKFAVRLLLPTGYPFGRMGCSVRCVYGDQQVHALAEQAVADVSSGYFYLTRVHQSLFRIFHGLGS